MGRKDGRIEPGQSLNTAISAGAWNRMMDAADIVHGGRYGVVAGTSQPLDTPYTWIYGRTNNSVQRWQPVQITGIAGAPTSDYTETVTRSFETVPVVYVSTVSETVGTWGTSGTVRQFGIAVDPIAADAIGRVAIGGIVQARVVNVSNYHPYARCTSSGTLESAWDGTAAIVWRGGASNSGTEQWMLLRLGQEHHRPMLNGTFSAPWPKDGYADVNVGGKTISALNAIGNITGSGIKRCIIGFMNGDDSTYEWRLVAGEYTYQQQT